MKNILTSSQSTFFTEQITENIPVWNQSLVVAFKGEKASHELNYVINRIIEKNDIFRLRFEKTADGEIRQSFYEFSESEFSHFRFESEQELQAFLSDIADEPTSIFNNPYVFYSFQLPDKYGIILRIHHILCDGFCVPLIIEKIKSELGMGVEETEIYSYEDHVAEELKFRDSRQFQKSTAFWNRALSSDFQTALFYSGHSSYDYSASEYSYSFSPEAVNKAKRICEKENIPFSSFIYAVFGIYVKAFLKIGDFSVGMPVLNRVSENDYHTLGLYMHILPLILHIDDDATFLSVLDDTYCSMIDLMKHQRFTQYDIHNNCPSAENKTSFFDVTVDFQPELYEPDCETKLVFSSFVSTPLEIHFYEKRDNTVFVRVRYRKNLFSEKDIFDMFENIGGIWDAFTENPESPVCEVELEKKYTLTSAERHTLLHTFNDTEVAYRKDKCIHELFEEQVRKTPEKTAVKACDKTLTYRELNEEANKIANSLIEKGIGAGDTVAFALSRKSFLLTAIFGIMKTGAAYLPVDPDYPKDRTEYILKDSGAKLFITDENISELTDGNNKKDPHVKVTGENPCYCIYTSGSTGKPKGVLLSHRNAVNYVSDNDKNVMHRIIKEEYETIVSVTTVGFDIFVTEGILPLVNGKTVILANENESKLQSELNKLLKKHPADVMQTTPSKLKLLISDKTQLDYLKRLKAIIIGGEVLDVHLAKELKQLTKAEIFNIYGPTETTVWSTAVKITDPNNISIGKPISNTQIYIVDKRMSLVPVGVTGELLIGGDGVGEGYINRPELTAEKFIDNPFGEGRVYKTGDLAYWREDGNIMYVGRNDFQVKIRGLRIELGEIENSIMSVEGIQQAVVVVRKNKEERQLICAFYTGEEKDSSEIKKAIGKQLPRYMLPHIITHIDEIPLTASGKVDRNGLPETDIDNIETNVEYVAPETEKEKALESSVKEVLGADNAGMFENFFDMGGDSLKSIELISKLEKRGYTTEVKAVFDSENLKELAEKLTEKETETGHTEYSTVMPLTPAQLRVYTAQSMEPQSTLYNIPYIFKAENIDKERLEEAVNALIERHESLRTHIEVRDGEVYQVIDEKAKIKVESFEEDDALSFIKPFDLTVSPMVRVGYSDNTVIVDVHHIAADGESLKVFYRELNELYMGRTLKNEAVQYGEFAAETVDYEEAEKYWLEEYKGNIPGLELNTDYVRTERQSFKGSTVYDLLDKEIHNEVVKKCKELGVTAYVFYMTALSIMLGKYSGNEDMIIGIPISGRTSKYLEAVGMFVNTVATRVRPEGEKAVKEILGEVREVSVKALENQNYPFGELVKKLGITSQGRNPLFDVMFAYQNEEMTEIVIGDKKAELLPVPITTAKCDMTFGVMPRSEDVVISVNYCTDLYREATIEKYISAFKRIVREMSDETKLIKDIDSTDEAERHTLLHTFNDTEVAYRKTATLYSLFEDYARSNADKVCLICENREITYGEFISGVERLAARIYDLTHGKKQVIGVCADRSLEMYTAIYAVIRGGNAYMPIDTAQPVKRTEYMTENSGASLVLCRNKYIENITSAQCIDLDEFLSSNEPEYAPCPVAATSDDAAYVIYTSGTTGNPKGAVIRHRSAVNRITWMHQKYPVDENSVILQKTPYTFDVSVWEIFWWGMFGGKLAYSKPQEHFLPEKIIGEIIRNKVTHIHFVPSVFSVFLDYVEENSGTAEKLTSLKYIFLSGEALSGALVERFYRLFDGTNVGLHNLYGPTECAVDVTYYDCEKTDRGAIPIGKPISNTQIYIVDKRMSLVPVGVTGELLIGGDGVGEGYINRPELTAEKFIDNPFGEGRVYKTGDLAYWREDGNIMYVGRNDFQVKINGQRVETDEIEYVISSVAGISSSVVLLKKTESGSILVAFYTGNAFSEKYLVGVCREKLPKYMIPSCFVRLETMPLNNNGKADKKQLEAIDITACLSTGDESPVNSAEQMICDSFSELLGIENVNRNTDFIRAGGTSINIISFLSDSRYKELTMSDFIVDPTPSGVAKRLMEKQSSTFRRLSLIKHSDGAERAVVIFPFAGGTAASFAALADRLCSELEASVYFAPSVHSDEELRELSDETEKLSEFCDVAVYSHCVGGMLAIRTAKRIEERGAILKGIVFAGFVPGTKKNSRNIWDFVPKSIIRSILEGAGADISSLPRAEEEKLLDSFVKDTDYTSRCLNDFKGRINTPARVILSENDFFTKSFKKPERNFGVYLEHLLSVEVLEGNNHYFQTEKADLIVSAIKSAFER